MTAGPQPDLLHPDRFTDGPPHAAFAELRRREPVSRQQRPDGSTYWAVLRHADVLAVTRQPALFSSAAKGVLLEDLSAEQLRFTRDMLLMMDPPRHAALRRVVVPAFMPAAIGRLEASVREISRRLLAEAAQRVEVEFVHEVCAHVPSQVVGTLLGIPEQDRARVHGWAERISGGQDPELAAAGDAASANLEMALYALELAARRRADPGADIVSRLLVAGPGGEPPLTDEAFASFFVQLVTAGNDTTRTLLSSALHTLLRHPAALAALRADPRRIPGAVEEVLRWSPPLHYFRRTATADTVLGGARIAAGDPVVLVFTSANRDEAVFARPDAFDPARSPNRHLSFGFAEHYCLGVHLARLESRVFLAELLATFAEIDATGPAVRQRSNLNNALKRLPVRLAGARRGEEP